jgi:hypothetical protein
MLQCSNTLTLSLGTGEQLRACRRRDSLRAAPAKAPSRWPGEQWRMPAHYVPATLGNGTALARQGVQMDNGTLGALFTLARYGREARRTRLFGRRGRGGPAED